MTVFEKPKSLTDAELHYCPGLPITAHQVQGAAHHVPAAGGDNGVGLGVDAAAQLIPLSPGDLHGLTGAEAHVHAVLPATGRTVVAGGDDLVVLHDDRAVAPAQAGGPLQHRLGDVQIVVFLADAFHRAASFALLLLL